MILCDTFYHFMWLSIRIHACIFHSTHISVHVTYIYIYTCYRRSKRKKMKQGWYTIPSSRDWMKGKRMSQNPTTNTKVEPKQNKETSIKHSPRTRRIRPNTTLVDPKIPTITPPLSCLLIMREQRMVAVCCFSFLSFEREKSWRCIRLNENK